MKQAAASIGAKTSSRHANRERERKFGHSYCISCLFLLLQHSGPLHKTEREEGEEEEEKPLLIAINCINCLPGDRERERESCPWIEEEGGTRSELPLPFFISLPPSKKTQKKTFLCPEEKGGGEEEKEEEEVSLSPQKKKKEREREREATSSSNPQRSASEVSQI